MDYSAMGIDTWEVIEAPKTKLFGFMPFYPGPGLGGHCIPIDPFYINWKANTDRRPASLGWLAKSTALCPNIRNTAILWKLFQFDKGK